MDQYQNSQEDLTKEEKEEVLDKVINSASNINQVFKKENLIIKFKNLVNRIKFFLSMNALNSLPKKFLVPITMVSGIIVFILLITMLLSLILFSVSLHSQKKLLENTQQSFKEERKEWYKSYYFLDKEIDNSAVVAYRERKKNFQLKIAGIIKDANGNLTDREILSYTEYVFDQSEQYGWDPYLAIAVAWKETKFDKKAIGAYNDKGLYQFLPSTAVLVSKFANLDYYTGIEFDVVSSTKLWFAYTKILVDRFDGSLECALLSYNMGEQRLIELSHMKVNKDAGVLDVQSADLKRVRKIIYYDSGKKLAYDEEILKYMYEIKMVGINNEIETKLNNNKKSETNVEKPKQSIEKTLDVVNEEKSQ